MSATRRWLLIVLLASAPYAAATMTFQPAGFGKGPESIHSTFRLPDALPDGLYRIRCQAFIDGRGMASAFTCLTQGGAAEKALARQLTLAGENARYSPAMDANEAISVFMTVTALIRVQQGKSVIGIFPNDGEHWGTLGMNYVSPQRIQQFGQLSNDFGRTTRSTMLVTFRIGADGRLLNTTFSQKSARLMKRDVGNAQRAIAQMQFRPGFHNGNPVEMDYVELYYVYD